MKSLTCRYKGRLLEVWKHHKERGLYGGVIHGMPESGISVIQRITDSGEAFNYLKCLVDDQEEQVRTAAGNLDAILSKPRAAAPRAFRGKNWVKYL
jgi:hypothetical protein